jgi:hypothetical protein
MDLKKLRADVQKLKAKRTPSPIGRTKTGATAILRKNYSEILFMHENDGLRWTEIALALAAQGVTQGNGAPITGRRITALMRNLALQAERETSNSASRLQRKDIAPHQIEHRDDTKTKLRLAPELTAQKTNHPIAVVSEDEIRRGLLERHAHLLKRK